MQAYTGFAYVYDEYMDNIPYEEWCEYLVERLKEQGVTPDMSMASSLSTPLSNNLRKLIWI